MKPSLTSFSHFLLIQTAFIGDTTLSLFVANALKTSHPHCKISFVCTPICSEMLSSSKDIDAVLPFDKRNSQKGMTGIKQFAKQLSTENIDCIINLHSSFRSSLLSLLTKAQYRITFAQSALSFLFSARIKRPQHGSERERQLHLLSLFSDIQPIPYSAIQFRQNLQPTSVDRFLEKYKLQNKPFVVIAPNSVWSEKRWELPSFQQVCTELSNANIPVIVIGSTQDRDYCKPLLEQIHIIDAVGIFSLAESIELIDKAAVVVSNDSAPIHFASVVNTPTIAIFGPTIPAFGFGPLAEKSIILENNNLPCRPCSHNGSQPCKIGTHECMTSITVENVVQETMKFFERTNNKQLYNQ